MKLVCIMRMKNEEERISEFIQSHPFIDEYCIIDNGSTDGSVALLQSYNTSNNIRILSTEGFQEGRDKNLALQLALTRSPDWLIWMDWDEIFEAKARIDLIKLMTDYPNVVGWSFRLYVFWRGRTHYRVDHAWGNFVRKPQLRLVKFQPQLKFSERRIHAGTFLGLKGERAVSDLRIKHFTVENEKWAKLKFDRYRKLDPKRPDGYRHLISADGIQLKKWEE